MTFGGLALVIGIIVLMYVRENLDRQRTPERPVLPVISTVSAFTLTNQLGRAVSLKDLRGNPWVANVIFTRCPGPCLALSKKVADLQSKLPKEKNIRLVTLTIDPDFDSPEILARYGEKLGADPDAWWFLTGTKEELTRLAIRDLKFSARDKNKDEMETPDDLFIHSTYFMVVDQDGRLRGAVDSNAEYTDESGNARSAVDETLAVLEQLN